jgi:hypothetical protein
VDEALKKAEKLDFTTIKPNVAIYAKKETGKEIRRLASLESQWDAAVKALDDTSQTITDYELYKLNKSKMQMRFTCFRSELITMNIRDIFFDDVKKSTGSITLKHAAPLPDISEYDFTDLVGTVVACAANNSQKGVKSIVGGVVRGLSFAGLNNEVLAEVVGALLGGVAKKVAEAFAYKFLYELITNKKTGVADSDRKVILYELIKLYTNHLIHMK